MSLQEMINQLSDENSLSAKPRPYINHSVEIKRPFTRQERTEMMEKVGMNVFFFPSEMITGCDFLSDSGTTTMTNYQY